MARIKSALEIAMEKTESVKGDKTSINQFEAKQRGKKLANEFLDDPGKPLADEIKNCPKDEKDSLKQGVFDVLVSQLVLPGKEEDLPRIEGAVSGVKIILNNSQFNEMAKQFSQLLRQFLSEASKYEEAIKRQYAPKLRQKEEEIARRLGRQVSLDPFQDPEFVAFFNQNMNALKENYQSAIDQIKEAAVEMYV